MQARGLLAVGTRELPQELEPRASKHRRWLSLCRGHVAIGVRFWPVPRNG